MNEAEGNPIEIAAIVVWRVVDSAKATFNVDTLDKFVEKQTEAAIRMLATKYPYDKHGDQKISLHENLGVVNDQLRLHVSQSVTEVGIEIVEARISHLAYAPEIAAAMLHADSKPKRSSPPAKKSSRARSEWSTWPSLS